MRVCAMRAGKSLSVSSADAGRLSSVVQDRNAPQKHVWRAEIVVLTAEGVGTNAIMRRTGKSKTCVRRWQERFIEEGFDGLSATRRVPRASSRSASRRPSASSHDARGTARGNDPLDRRPDVEGGGAQREFGPTNWRAHGLQPHRMRQFKLSNDPRFVDKLRDVVGLYVDPPAHAIVLSVDERAKFRRLIERNPDCR